MTHRDVQREGREEVFEDYRLRVGEVVAPGHDAATVTVTETPPERDPPPIPSSSGDLVAAERFQGITTPGAHLVLATWRAPETAIGDEHVRVIRDYGMHRREQAPRHFPPVASACDAGTQHG